MTEISGFKVGERVKVEFEGVIKRMDMEGRIVFFVADDGRGCWCEIHDIKKLTDQQQQNNDISTEDSFKDSFLKRKIMTLDEFKAWFYGFSECVFLKSIDQDIDAEIVLKAVKERLDTVVEVDQSK